MARKSAALRLSQTLQLITDYEGVTLANHRNCRFARDMAFRLERDRGLSPKQRTWLDNIIEEGVPEPKNPERVALFEAASEVVGMEGKAHILRDFASRARMGYALSEKQEAFVSSLLAEAERYRLNGPYIPAEDLVQSLRLAVKLAKARSGAYWGTHPGEQKAVQATTNWIEWLDSGSEEIRPSFDEWAANKVLNTFKNKLTELSSPRFALGEMRWLWQDGDYHPALVMDGPLVNGHGSIYYAALVDGTVVETSNLTKVRRRS